MAREKPKSLSSNDRQSWPEFEQNGFYERLLILRQTNRKAFESISPVSKLALCEYERQKRAAAEAEAMRHEASDLPPTA